MHLAPVSWRENMHNKCNLSYAPEVHFEIVSDNEICLHYLNWSDSMSVFQSLKMI